MKIIKINLLKQQIPELKQLQRKFGDYRSERVLHWQLFIALAT